MAAEPHGKGSVSPDQPAAVRRRRQSRRRRGQKFLLERAPRLIPPQPGVNAAVLLERSSCGAHGLQWLQPLTASALPTAPSAAPAAEVSSIASTSASGARSGSGIGSAAPPTCPHTQKKSTGVNRAVLMEYSPRGAHGLQLLTASRVSVDCSGSAAAGSV